MTSPCSVHIFGFPRRISLHPLDLAPFLEPLYFLVEFVQNLLHVLNIEQVFVVWAFDIASLGRQQSWVRPPVWSTPHGLSYIWTIISQSPCSAKWKLQKKRIRKRRNTCFILGHWNRLSLVVSLQEIRWISTSCILCGVGLIFTGFEGKSVKISMRFCVTSNTDHRPHHMLCLQALSQGLTFSAFQPWLGNGESHSESEDQRHFYYT